MLPPATFPESKTREETANQQIFSSARLHKMIDCFSSLQYNDTFESRAVMHCIPSDARLTSTPPSCFLTYNDVLSSSATAMILGRKPLSTRLPFTEPSRVHTSKMRDERLRASTVCAAADKGRSLK